MTVVESVNRIQQFSADGFFLRSWGAPGIENGEFLKAQGVAVDANGNLYVSDPSDCRIQKFSSTGTYLGEWGNGGSFDGLLLSPEGIDIDGAGDIYVADAGNNRIQKFRPVATAVTQDSLGPQASVVVSPNPLNPRTRIHYSVPVDGFVSLVLYDVQGRGVAKIHEANSRAGSYSTCWNGLDGSGTEVSSGVYMLRMQSDGGVATEKLVVLR